MYHFIVKKTQVKCDNIILSQVISISSKLITQDSIVACLVPQMIFTASFGSADQAEICNFPANHKIASIMLKKFFFTGNNKMNQNKKDPSCIVTVL